VQKNRTKISHKKSNAQLKNKYNFVQWYKLNLYARANLISVVEGLRHGVIIEMFGWGQNDAHDILQKKLLECCLKKFKLFYKKEDELYYVCDNRQMLKKLWNNQLCVGDFLGYPECCIKTFDKRIEKVTAKNSSQKGPAVLFSRKLHQQLLEGFHVTQCECSICSLLYTFHVPCRINCKKALYWEKKLKTH